MRMLSSLSLLCVGLIGSACSEPPPPPDGDDALAYFGMTVGTTSVYAVGEASEEHQHAASDASFDGATVQLTARRNGFAAPNRSFTVGANGTDVVILRVFDCLARCRLPNAPIAMATWPLEAGAVKETTVQVELIENGVTNRVANETHRFLVGDAESITVPAGTYPEAYPISWTQTTPDGSSSATLYVAPSTGIVVWLNEDGERLELSAQE
jgi:hypothetical protein